MGVGCKLLAGSQGKRVWLHSCYTIPSKRRRRSEEGRRRNGLRQGCALAPSLINRYVSAVVSNWQIQSPDAGVTALYKHYRELVGDCTPKGKLSQVKVTETQFVDNAALHTTSQQALKAMTVSFLEVASEVGLTVQRN